MYQPCSCADQPSGLTAGLVSQEQQKAQNTRQQQQIALAGWRMAQLQSKLLSQAALVALVTQGSVSGANKRPSVQPMSVEAMARRDASRVLASSTQTAELQRLLETEQSRCSAMAAQLLANQAQQPRSVAGQEARCTELEQQLVQFAVTRREQQSEMAAMEVQVQDERSLREQLEEELEVLLVELDAESSMRQQMEQQLSADEELSGDEQLDGLSGDEQLDGLLGELEQLGRSSGLLRQSSRANNTELMSEARGPLTTDKATDKATDKEMIWELVSETHGTSANCATLLSNAAQMLAHHPTHAAGQQASGQQPSRNRGDDVRTGNSRNAMQGNRHTRSSRCPPCY